ncbi:MAG: ceramidase domain-containing protein [Gemmatimonadales bacterium]
MPIDWSTWLPATCLPTACFCERIGAGLIRQPANTWSSLLFLVPAAIALVAARRSSLARALAVRYAAALTVIGLGSAFFHASLSFVGQTIDVLGMYLLVTLVAVTAAERLRLVTSTGASRLYWTTNLVLAAVLVTLPTARRLIFAALALLAIGLEWSAAKRTPNQARPYLIGAIGALGLGFLFWTLDLTGTLCRPDSILQGHAIWHGLGALAAALHWRGATTRAA